MTLINTHTPLVRNANHTQKSVLPLRRQPTESSQRMYKNIVSLDSNMEHVSLCVESKQNLIVELD